MTIEFFQRRSNNKKKGTILKLANLFNIRRQINKPEYYLRPKQLLKRIVYKNKGRQKVSVSIDRSSQPFYVNENEVIGAAILSQGVYDLIVGECLYRLLKKGDCFVDIGANIGYFSRQALHIGAEVHSFEPHPKVYARLEENLQNQDNKKIYQLALSEQAGQFDLYVPTDFSKNEGIASLNPMPHSEKVVVSTETLDNMGFENIELMKIDVEGHEASVLNGANKLLSSKKIKNIVFEDFDGTQSKTIRILKDAGYKVFRLQKTLMGPRIVSIEEGLTIPPWEPPNYVATFDEQSLQKTFQKNGWRMLNSI